MSAAAAALFTKAVKDEGMTVYITHQHNLNSFLTIKTAAVVSFEGD